MIFLIFPFFVYSSISFRLSTQVSSIDLLLSQLLHLGRNVRLCCAVGGAGYWEQCWPGSTVIIIVICRNGSAALLRLSSGLQSRYYELVSVSFLRTEKCFVNWAGERRNANCLHLRWTIMVIGYFQYSPYKYSTDLPRKPRCFLAGLEKQNQSLFQLVRRCRQLNRKFPLNC